MGAVTKNMQTHMASMTWLLSDSVLDLILRNDKCFFTALKCLLLIGLSLFKGKSIFHMLMICDVRRVFNNKPSLHAWQQF